MTAGTIRKMTAITLVRTERPPRWSIHLGRGGRARNQQVRQSTALPPCRPRPRDHCQRSRGGDRCGKRRMTEMTGLPWGQIVGNNVCLRTPPLAAGAKVCNGSTPASLSLAMPWCVLELLGALVLPMARLLAVLAERGIESRISTARCASFSRTIG